MLVDNGKPKAVFVRSTAEKSFLEGLFQDGLPDHEGLLSGAFPGGKAGNNKEYTVRTPMPAARLPSR